MAVFRRGVRTRRVGQVRDLFVAASSLRLCSACRAVRHARTQADNQRTCSSSCNRHSAAAAAAWLLPLLTATASTPHLSAQGVVLVAAAFWLFFCTYMFHGVLEGQLSLSDSAEVRQVAPTERECGGWARSWCEQRVAQHRAAAVRQGMQHAWAGYKAYAWGADEIHPQSKTAKTDIMVRLQAAGSLATRGTTRCNTGPPGGT